ncbi:MAG: CPBP family intramembrane metalloprotease [Hadesarchaea archaeon]|nr:CPBP family intramembrane metalloprotease [Hadesarchaea archaeon]
MKNFNFGKNEIIELILIIGVYLLTTFMAFFSTLKIEWIWRVPQAALPWFIILVWRKATSSIGLTIRNFFKNLGWGIITAIILTIILIPIYQFIWPPKMPESLYFDVWLWMSVFVVGNVLVIELFYRGCLQTRLSNSFNPKIGIIIVSVLASFDFFEFRVFNPIIVGVAALVFSYLYYKTSSVVTPLSAHILWFLLTPLALLI